MQSQAEITILSSAEGSSWGKDVISAPFCLAVLSSLTPHELCQLEATCASLRETLSSKTQTAMWAVSAHAVARQYRLELPLGVLSGMPLTELKNTIGILQPARGLLNNDPVQVLKQHELTAVSAACSRAQRDTARDVPLRVVVGRAYFDEEDLIAVAEEDETEDAPDEELLCFSSDVVFSWPGPEGESDTTLTASFGLRQGMNILEVTSDSNPPGDEIQLAVDVHIVGPEWPAGQSTIEGFEVEVDGQCCPSATPVLDVSNEKTRACLSDSDGFLVVMVVRGQKSTQGTAPLIPRPAAQKTAKAPTADLKTLA